MKATWFRSFGPAERVMSSRHLLPTDNLLLGLEGEMDTRKITGFSKFLYNLVINKS